MGGGPSFGAALFFSGYEARRDRSLTGPAIVPAQLAAAAVDEVIMHNVHNVQIMGEDGQTPAREFRVSDCRRYKVTDWERFNGGSVSVVAENLTLAQANRIATELGLAHPGSLVNTMEPPYEGSYVMVTAPAAMDVAISLSNDGALPAEVSLRTLPYPVAAALRSAVQAIGDAEMISLFERAAVAVDVVQPRLVNLTLRDALATRDNLKCFHMSTDEIDDALSRAGYVVTAP